MQRNFLSFVLNETVGMEPNFKGLETDYVNINPKLKEILPANIKEWIAFKKQIDRAVVLLKELKSDPQKMIKSWYETDQKFAKAVLKNDYGRIDRAIKIWQEKILSGDNYKHSLVEVLNNYEGLYSTYKEALIDYFGHNDFAFQHFIHYVKDGFFRMFRKELDLFFKQVKMGMVKQAGEELSSEYYVASKMTLKDTAGFAASGKTKIAFVGDRLSSYDLYNILPRIKGVDRLEEVYFKHRLHVSYGPNEKLSKHKIVFNNIYFDGGHLNKADVKHLLQFKFKNVYTSEFYYCQKIEDGKMWLNYTDLDSLNSEYEDLVDTFNVCKQLDIEGDIKHIIKYSVEDEKYNDEIEEDDEEYSEVTINPNGKRVFNAKTNKIILDFNKLKDFYLKKFKIDTILEEDESR
jgi:hypothetical protein